MEFGGYFSKLVEEITQTYIGSFAWMDVLVSAIVLIGFILFEGKRNGMSLTITRLNEEAARGRNKVPNGGAVRPVTFILLINRILRHRMYLYKLYKWDCD